MKKTFEVEVTTDQAIEVLTEESGLSKEQSLRLYTETGGTVRHMGFYPFTVDEAIATISGVLIGGSSEDLLSEAQQMQLYKGLAGNPKALTELANMSWSNRDVIDFLKARFGGKVMSDKATLLANIENFLDNEL